MIDWYVLLVALILLPILLLFGFVGCVLNREGAQGSPITFTYQPGLDVDVQSIVVTFAVAVSSEDNGGSQFPVTSGPFTRSSGTILPAGETITDGSAGLDEVGTVTCTCTVTMKPPEPGPFEEPQPGTVFPLSLPKNKVEDENAPAFALVRDGTGLKLV